MLRYGTRAIGGVFQTVSLSPREEETFWDGVARDKWRSVWLLQRRNEAAEVKSGGGGKSRCHVPPSFSLPACCFGL